MSSRDQDAVSSAMEEIEGGEVKLGEGWEIGRSGEETAKVGEDTSPLSRFTPKL